MFQKELEAQPPEARAELQRERLRALRRRLLGLDSRYWRAKLDGIEEDAALADLPFTIKSELRDEYPFGTLAVPLAETVRGSAQPSSRRQAATSSSSCSRTSARRGWRARRALRCCSRSVAPAATFTCVYGVFRAEPWSEAMREKLEAVWGIDACDIYGLSEVIGPGVACECREGEGVLHVFDDHFLPEVVDPETGEAIDGAGELVLTTLTKEALPVLRYRTGDATRFVESACGCGRTHRRIARFSGRVDDMLVVRGVNVFPSEIEEVVSEHHAAGDQYAIVVDRRQPMPELEVRTELAREGDVDAIAAQLQSELERRLRLRPRVSVGLQGTLPRQQAGKARRVYERLDDTDPVGS